MRSSYFESDVQILLKDVTGFVKPQPTQERERLIQSGRHYCEMLPIEYIPTKEYMQAYQDALKHYADATAQAVGILADKIIQKRGKNVVLVSLARAGIPIGILIKHYIRQKYNIDVPHYAISIIRGMGMDHNAMRYLLQRHQAQNLLFVDGWIGKGAILRELKKEAAKFQGVSGELAVVADPTNSTELYGTHEDLLIPSSCLNSTVSGLISRTFYRKDIIGESDFHGAVYYNEWKEQDLSNSFLTEIESRFVLEKQPTVKLSQKQPEESKSAIEEVQKIASDYAIQDINLIKPGIGETTRVLLRRVPWKVLIGQKYREDPSLRHIIRLAQEKGVFVEYYPLENYKACGIIQKMADI